MIVTVTMNPAIDKTVDLEHFEHGGLNRLNKVLNDAGGKGINVSKTIKALGGSSVATGFIGGSSGTAILRMLKEMEISSDFVEVKGETRTNLKVVECSGFVTELNEPGPEISKSELEDLTEKLLGYAGEDTLFVFAGSIPSGVDKGVYRELIAKVREKGAKVFLDADGELFVNALDAVPDIIKPNRVELEEYFNLDYRASEEELVELGRRFLDRGIGMVAVSMGQMGALFLTKERTVKVPGLQVEAHSTVGAGDAMVAAVSYGLDQKMGFEECIRLGVAASAGAVTTKGTKPPSLSLVEELKGRVEFIEL